MGVYRSESEKQRLVEGAAHLWRQKLKRKEDLAAGRTPRRGSKRLESITAYCLRNNVGRGEIVRWMKERGVEMAPLRVDDPERVYVLPNGRFKKTQGKAKPHRKLVHKKPVHGNGTNGHAKATMLGQLFVVKWKAGDAGASEAFNGIDEALQKYADLAAAGMSDVRVFRMVEEELAVKLNITASVVEEYDEEEEEVTEEETETEETTHA